MTEFESLEENFRFLVLEVEHQVKLTFGMLNDASTDRLEKIVSKDDYVDNLKTIIENECFSRLHRSGALTPEESHYIRAIHAICVNLERIADFSVNIARQTEYFIEFTILHQADYTVMFALIQRCMGQILPALKSRNLQDAIEICRAEKELDGMYKENFDWIMARMRRGHYIEDLITTLFIFRYLERIGDALLNIGEALIFGVIGERIKIDQLDALQETLSRSDLAATVSQVDFTSILGSRSGCRIGRIETGNGAPDGSKGIFKEGNKHKIRLEKQSIERWETILPGLTPKVFGYRENRDSASLLVEYLPGYTLDAMVLHSDDGLVDEAVGMLEDVLLKIWNRTFDASARETNYMVQLNDRLEAVQRVHPGFIYPGRRIQDVAVPATRSLITQCAQLERSQPAPFSVLIHGDFNVNNIVWNPRRQRINFVDLYRSTASDYIQDVSVFLVSNFRLPVFDQPLRRRLNNLNGRFLTFARAFALRQQDATFELRLALALARSFFTSTRFELNRDFSGDMVNRAHYLLERLIGFHKEWTDFRVPEEILYY